MMGQGIRCETGWLGLGCGKLAGADGNRNRPTGMPALGVLYQD